MEYSKVLQVFNCKLRNVFYSFYFMRYVAVLIHVCYRANIDELELSVKDLLHLEFVCLDLSRFNFIIFNNQKYSWRET